MKIIQEENYEYAMRNEVEPYLAAHCRDKFVTGAKEDGQGKTTRAAKLHVKFYETERPKGVVIVSHGFTEGVPKYDEMVYYFLKAGYHVCIPEHTGHGLSYRLTEDPSLVHIDTWKRFVRDFLKICHHTVRRYPNLPRFLFAHSMGGAIGTIARCVGTGSISENHTEFADDPATYGKCAVAVDCCNRTDGMSCGKSEEICDWTEAIRGK